jgi:predicted secreted protein
VLGSAPQAGSAFAWTVAEIDINGTAAQAPTGALWTVDLDGTLFQYTRKLGDSLNTVAAGLADAINQSGTRFATKYTLATLKLAGTPHAGDVWKLTLDSLTVSYTALATDTLATIAAALENQIDNNTSGQFTASSTATSVTLNRIGSAPFAIKLSVTGTNLQSNGQVTGSTGSDHLIVFTTDATPFTVDVRLAQSASAVGFISGATVRADDGAGPSASVQSTTHYSKLVLKLNNVTPTTAPIVQGAGWNLVLGTKADQFALDFSGTPAAGEVWTLRLQNADGWKKTVSHAVVGGDTLTTIVNDLRNQINSALSGYSATAAASSAGRLLTVERMGAFDLTFSITPAAGQATSAAQAVITESQSTFAFGYTAAATGRSRRRIRSTSLSPTTTRRACWCCRRVSPPMSSSPQNWCALGRAS